MSARMKSTIPTTPLKCATIMLVVVAILYLAHGSALAAASAESPRTIGYVSGLTGEAVILRGDRYKNPIDWQQLDWNAALRESRAQLRQPIQTGDIVLTRRGVVQVRFSHVVEPPTEMGVELAECRIANLTEIHLSDWRFLGPAGGQPASTSPAEYDTTSILELRQGEVHCKTQGSGSFKMQWNVGSSRVTTQGTEMTISYNPTGEHLSVAVQEGRVAVTGPGGSRVVKAGQTTRFVRGRPAAARPPS